MMNKLRGDGRGDKWKIRVLGSIRTSNFVISLLFSIYIQGVKANPPQQSEVEPW